MYKINQTYLTLPFIMDIEYITAVKNDKGNSDIVICSRGQKILIERDVTDTSEALEKYRTIVQNAQPISDADVLNKLNIVLASLPKICIDFITTVVVDTHIRNATEDDMEKVILQINNVIDAHNMTNPDKKTFFTYVEHLGNLTIHLRRKRKL